MKFIENIIEKVIVKKLKTINLKSLLTRIYDEHKEEIKEVIKKTVQDAVKSVIEKVKK